MRGADVASLGKRAISVDQIEKERDHLTRELAPPRERARQSIHDVFCKSDHQCTFVSISRDARWCGGRGCGYFQKNERARGLFAGMRWHFVAGVRGERRRRMAWSVVSHLSFASGVRPFEGIENEVQGTEY